MKRTLSVALVQMSSANSVEKNLKYMERATKKAAQEGAEWVVFPEMAYQMAEKKRWLGEINKYPSYLETFSEWAYRYKVLLVPGSLREPSGRPGCYFNSLPLISPSGDVLCTYRKIHLFEANLPERRYSESEYTEAGGEPMVVDADGVRVGLSICFDLRFPELYRRLKKAGAEVVLIPSAFVFHTGKAHWEVLLRARAIENQVFVLAPNQTGEVETGRTFGHSMIVSPWGEILAVKKSGPGIVVAKLNLGDLVAVKAKVDAWASRRNDLFAC